MLLLLAAYCPPACHLALVIVSSCSWQRALDTPDWWAPRPTRSELHGFSASLESFHSRLEFLFHVIKVNAAPPIYIKLYSSIYAWKYMYFGMGEIHHQHLPLPSYCCLWCCCFYAVVQWNFNLFTSRSREMTPTRPSISAVWGCGSAGWVDKQAKKIPKQKKKPKHRKQLALSTLSKKLTYLISLCLLSCDFFLIFIYQKHSPIAHPSKQKKKPKHRKNL